MWKKLREFVVDGLYEILCIRCKSFFYLLVIPVAVLEVGSYDRVDVTFSV